MKRTPKSVQKSPGGKSAASTLGPAENAIAPILYAAPRIPDGIDITVLRFHTINVRAEGDKFRLYNHESPAGPRLVKTDSDEPKGLRFPFSRDQWWLFDNIEDAKTAADQLQAYLDEFENPKLPAALKRLSKQIEDNFIPL